MQLPSWITDYFSFSRAEQRGLFVLFVFSALIVGLGQYYLNWRQAALDRQLVQYLLASEQLLADWKLELTVGESDSRLATDSTSIDPTSRDSFTVDSFSKGGDLAEQRSDRGRSQVGSRPVVPQKNPFDPNKVDSNFWLATGLPPWAVGRILKYRRKGGVFYKAADLTKIYGLNEADLAPLLPLVRIEAKSFILDVNKATAKDFERLRGIGPKLAKRLVSFRSSLGGFVHVEQFGELYGLSDSLYMLLRPQLTLSAPSADLIDINLATVDSLKAHPYIAPWVAKALVQYREEKGRFHDKSEILRLSEVNDSLYHKLAPYIVVKD